MWMSIKALHVSDRLFFSTSFLSAPEHAIMCRLIDPLNLQDSTFSSFPSLLRPASRSRSVSKPAAHRIHQSLSTHCIKQYRTISQSITILILALHPLNCWNSLFNRLLNVRRIGQRPVRSYPCKPLWHLLLQKYDQAWKWLQGHISAQRSKISDWKWNSEEHLAKTCWTFYRTYSTLQARYFESFARTGWHCSPETKITFRLVHDSSVHRAW